MKQITSKVQIIQEIVSQLSQQSQTAIFRLLIPDLIKLHSGMRLGNIGIETLTNFSIKYQQISQDIDKTSLLIKLDDQITDLLYLAKQTNDGSSIELVQNPTRVNEEKSQDSQEEKVQAINSHDILQIEQPTKIPEDESLEPIDTHDYFTEVHGVNSVIRISPRRISTQEKRSLPTSPNLNISVEKSFDKTYDFKMLKNSILPQTHHEIPKIVFLKREFDSKVKKEDQCKEKVAKREIIQKIHSFNPNNSLIHQMQKENFNTLKLLIKFKRLYQGHFNFQVAVNGISFQQGWLSTQIHKINEQLDYKILKLQHYKQQIEIQQQDIIKRLELLESQQ